MIPFVKFQKREEHPWRSATFSKVAVRRLQFSKVTLFRGCFSLFLNCTNGTKSRKALHVSLGSNRYYINLCLHFNLFQKSFGRHLSSWSVKIYLARKRVIFTAMGLFCRKYVQEMTPTDPRWTNMNMDLVVNEFLDLFRSSHRRSSVTKGGLKNFANFTGKHLCWSFFSMKLQVFCQSFFSGVCFLVKFVKFL